MTARAPTEQAGARAWAAVGAGVSSPAAASAGSGVVLVCRSASGELLLRERQALAWSEARSLGIPIATDVPSGTIPVDWPVAACAVAGRVHLLARGPEGELVHGILGDGAWSGFSCIGIPTLWSGLTHVPMGLVTPPSACSRSPDTLEVFAVGAGGDLLHAPWDNSGFGEFVSLGSAPSGMPLTGPVSACSCGPDRVDVFARGITGELLLKSWDGLKWTAFKSLGAPQVDDVFYPGNPRPVPLSGAPAACAGGTRRLDVFARGADGDLLHRYWDGNGWSAFASLGMPIDADGSPVAFAGPVACAWGRSGLDVFAPAADGKLYNLSWMGIAAPGLT